MIFNDFLPTIENNSKSVINEFDGKRKSYRSYWFCQISVGFTDFCKKINGFKLKSPILDV